MVLSCYAIISLDLYVKTSIPRKDRIRMESKPEKVTLNDLFQEVESIFEFVRFQSTSARENLHKTDSLGEADETERSVLSKLLKIGQRLMTLYFCELGTGDLGTRTVVNETEYVRRIKDRQVNCLTIFGKVDFLHSLYYAKDGSCLKPVEAMANLPERKASYFLQDLFAQEAVDKSYEKSKNFFKSFSDLRISKRTIEEVVKEMADHHEEYETKNNLPKKTEEGSIGVVNFDGKGVHVVPEDRKGKGTTKEALVSTTYTINPNPRTAEEVTQALVFPSSHSKDEKKSKEPRERARNIHYDCSIQKEKSEVFQSTCDVSKKRFAKLLVPLVCIMDGATILWKHARDYFPNAIYILDIIHVLEYIWEAAKVLEPKKEKAQRKLVAAYLQQILEGKVKTVIRALRQRITKNGIKGSKLEDLEKVITYFENHIQYMNYDKYLANGYPIGSGVVESACGHIVKDRMDKSGAWWRIVGVEPMLKLRCVKANDDWNLYTKSRKNEERKRLYDNMLNAA